MQDYFSHGFAACEYLERVRGLRERKGAIDMGGDFAFRCPLHQSFKISAILVRIESRPCAPEHAPDIAALQQREVQRHFGNVAALAAGEPAQTLLEVFLGVIQTELGAVSLGEFKLFI